MNAVGDTLSTARKFPTARNLQTGRDLFALRIARDGQMLRHGEERSWRTCSKTHDVSRACDVRANADGTLQCPWRSSWPHRTGFARIGDLPARSLSRSTPTEVTPVVVKGADPAGREDPYNAVNQRPSQRSKNPRRKNCRDDYGSGKRFARSDEARDESASRSNAREPIDAAAAAEPNAEGNSPGRTRAPDAIKCRSNQILRSTPPPRSISATASC